MALFFEQIKTDGIAQLSYIIGDASSGSAAVIDPRRDVEIYLSIARQQGLTISHIFETHNHADFVSGALEMKAHLDNATIYLSEAGGTLYGFEHETVRDGDEFDFGSVRLRACHTPGHTPEHISLLFIDPTHDAPWGICSGDSLFVGSAGRPDLMGDNADDLAEQLYHTLYDFYLSLDDEILLFPGHGAGSACGAEIGDRPISAIGYERIHNPFLQFDSLDAFKKFVIEGAPPAPAHYARLKKVNADGPEVLHGLPDVPPLTPGHFFDLAKRPDAVVLDARSMLAFGGGHVPGAVNIGPRDELSVWAADMLDPDHQILLVLEHDRDLPAILTLLLRTDVTSVVGYLAGSMKAWETQGYPLATLPQIDVHELHDGANHLIPLDVRSPAEWSRGHLPGAVHHFIGDLRNGKSYLDRSKAYAVYCGSGYRASLAASLLQARGFEHIRNVTGSMSAWKAAGYELVED